MRPYRSVILEPFDRPLGRHAAHRRPGAPPWARPWTRRQWGALAGVVVLLVAVVAAGVSARRTQPSNDSSAQSPNGTPATAFADSGRAAAAGPILHLPKVDLSKVSAADIPPAALSAYKLAANQTASHDRACHLRWWLLAGIGYVESAHARAGGSTRPGWDGMARPPILGPVLDGTRGYPRVADTDHGLFDRNTRWDRAVGPMQFLPGSWLRWGGRGPLHGHADPQELYDSAVAAGRFLCAGGVDLSAPGPLATAVYGYNHSSDFVHLVLAVAAAYAGLPPSALGVTGVPSAGRRQPATQHPATGATPQPQLSPAATNRPSPAATGTSPQPSPSQSSSSSQPIPLPTITRPVG